LAGLGGLGIAACSLVVGIRVGSGAEGEGERREAVSPMSMGMSLSSGVSTEFASHRLSVSYIGRLLSE
jgi:hypothetical protein